MIIVVRNIVEVKISLRVGYGRLVIMRYGIDHFHGAALDGRARGVDYGAAKRTGSVLGENRDRAKCEATGGRAEQSQETAGMR